MGGRMLSKQAIFDKVSVHLMKQMKKSKTIIDPETQRTICMYRNTDGLSCAVGCLLTDKEAKVADESEETDALAAVLPYRLNRNRKFLNELQTIHDMNHPGKWYTFLNVLAKEHNLNLIRVQDYLEHNCL